MTGISSFNPDPVAAIESIVASDGTVIPIGQVQQTLGYDGSGNLTSATVSFGGSQYVQTLTYTSGNLTGVTAWVKQ